MAYLYGLRLMYSLLCLLQSQRIGGLCITLMVLRRVVFCSYLVANATKVCLALAVAVRPRSPLLFAWTWLFIVQAIVARLLRLWPSNVIAWPSALLRIEWWCDPALVRGQWGSRAHNFHMYVRTYICRDHVYNLWWHIVHVVYRTWCCSCMRGLYMYVGC